MVGLDTNVLVRYLVTDDAQQLAYVDRLINQALAQNELLYLNVVVLCETAWVLRKLYQYSKTDVILALEGILDTQQFLIEEREIVVQALDMYRGGKADFSRLSNWPNEPASRLPTFGEL